VRRCPEASSLEAPHKHNQAIHTGTTPCRCIFLSAAHICAHCRLHTGNWHGLEKDPPTGKPRANQLLTNRQVPTTQSCGRATWGCQSPTSPQLRTDTIKPSVLEKRPPSLQPHQHVLHSQRHRLTIIVGLVVMSIHTYACIPCVNTLYTTCLQPRVTHTSDVAREGRQGCVQVSGSAHNPRHVTPE
jgi:hypothetical protein